MKLSRKKSAFGKIIDIFCVNKKNEFIFLIIFSAILGLFEFFGLVLIYQFILFLTGVHTPFEGKILCFLDTIFNIENKALINLFVGIFIAFIYIIKNILLLFYTKYYNKILTNLSNTITFEVIKTFLFQDYLKIKAIPNGQKLNILSKVDIVVWNYCLRIINLYSNIIIALILLSYLFIKFTALAVITLAVVGFLGIGEFIYLKKKSTYQNKNYSRATLNCGNISYKIVTLIKEIKISSKENYFVEDFKKKYKTLSKLNEERSFDGVLHIYLTEILIMVSFIIVLCALFYTSNFNNAKILSSLCTICIVILRLVPLINRIQSCLYVINSNVKITNEVLDFFEKYPSKKVQQYAYNPQNIDFKDKIIFNNLSFNYDDSVEGLKNLNLEIKKGEFIGITGESGCFKTTFLNILSGLISPKKGDIQIDGEILSVKNIKSWQNKISYIAQDHDLMYENVLDNFSLFSSHGADVEKIKKILFELGLETKVLNMQSSELSQGQKQRLALAAAIYQDKEILLLDEVTSSVDVLSQEKISELLNKLKTKKTIVSIAHRLQVLKHCDRIIFMENAKIVDFDTFENLDKKYPKFHEIVKLSSLKQF